jgi:hypothetical protein
MMAERQIWTGFSSSFAVAEALESGFQARARSNFGLTVTVDDFRLIFAYPV